MDPEKNTEINLNLRQEYTEVNNNLRHYGNMRFAQLTIFLAINGVLANIYFNTIPPNKFVLKANIALAGIFLSILFWTIEESATRKWKSFIKRAKKIERKLYYEQWNKFPSSGLTSATFATRFLMIGAIGFWLGTILSINH